MRPCPSGRAASALPSTAPKARVRSSAFIPETMTWSGSNLDIISGIVAIVTAPLASRSRAIAWVANLVGLVLLINVGRVAMMSSPLPFAWPVTPALQLVLYLPYAWIGPVCVAGALAGHVVLTRALLKPQTVS